MASTDAELEFTCRAYSKMIMHAAKYPHCAINGLLLATKDHVKAAAASAKAAIVIKDAIPLFHQSPGLTPMLEVALAQVESLADSAGLAVAGVYHGNEVFKDTSVDVFNQRIADKIAENAGHSLAVTIDNKKLGLVLESHALIVQQYTDGKWRSRDKTGLLLEEDTLEATSALLQKKLHKELVDFDNHLDSVERDYLNVDLNITIDRQRSVAV